MDAAHNQLERLRAHIRKLGSALVCYSGGIDSALVLAVCHEQLGARALGFTAVSPSLAPAERLMAEQFAQEVGAEHIFANSNEMARPGYVKNGPDRCYHCKSELYELAKLEQQKQKLNCILNGTNADDLGDYRPGLIAATESDVRSPLAELGFGKADIRAISKLLELKIWDKPASACLSSRIPYGTEVTEERLAQIGGFEAALKGLGFPQVRVRHHDKIARIEVPVDALPRLLQSPTRETVIATGKQFGFTYVVMDLAGYRQGSNNEVLQGKTLRVLS